MNSLREIEYKSRKLGENYAYNEIYNKKMLEFGNNHKPKTLTKVQYHYMISGFKEFADKRFVEYLDRESEISSEVFGLIQYDDFGGRVEIFSFNEGFSKEDLGQALEKAAKEKNPYFLCNNWIETLGLECGPNKICQEGKAWEKLTERDM